MQERPFFPGLVKYMSSGPVFAMVWEGMNAVTEGRKMLGATKVRHHRTILRLAFAFAAPTHQRGFPVPLCLLQSQPSESAPGTIRGDFALDVGR